MNIAQAPPAKVNTTFLLIFTLSSLETLFDEKTLSTSGITRNDAFSKPTQYTQFSANVVSNIKNIPSRRLRRTEAAFQVLSYGEKTGP